MDDSPLCSAPLHAVQTPDALRRFSLLLDGFRVVVNETEPGKIHADVMDLVSDAHIASATIPISVDQQHSTMLRKRKRLPSASPNSEGVEDLLLAETPLLQLPTNLIQTAISAPSNLLTLPAPSSAIPRRRPVRQSICIDTEIATLGPKRSRCSLPNITVARTAPFPIVSPHHISSPESVLPPSPTYSTRDLAPPSPIPEEQHHTFTQAYLFSHNASVRHEPPPSPPSPQKTVLPAPIVSIMQASALMQTYELFPESMQHYVLLQMLRRASPAALSLVAGLVQPALKRDFISLLPSAVSHNILAYLDKKSLCRASRVSRSWREAVDSDPLLWKFIGARDRLWDANSVDRHSNLRLRRLSAVQGILEASNRFNVSIDWSAYFSPRVLSLAQAANLSSPEPAISRQINPRHRTRSNERFNNIFSQESQQEVQERPFFSSPVQQTSSSSSSSLATVAPHKFAPLPSSPVPPAEQEINATQESKLLPATPHPFKHMYKRSTMLQHNWTTGKCNTHTFIGHASSVVTCLQFDDEKIVSGSDDQTICVYGIKTGELIRTLHGHEGGVWALQYVGNILVSGSTDRTVRVWDLNTGRTLHVFHGHTSTVRCLQILLPNNKVPVGRENARNFPRYLEPQNPFGNGIRKHATCVNDSSTDSTGGRHRIGTSRIRCCCCCPCFKSCEVVATEGGAIGSGNNHTVSGSLRMPVTCCCADPGTHASGYSASETSLSRHPTRYLKHALIVTGSRDASLRVWRLPLHSDVNGIPSIAGSGVLTTTTSNTGTSTNSNGNSDWSADGTNLDGSPVPEYMVFSMAGSAGARLSANRDGGVGDGTSTSMATSMLLQRSLSFPGSMSSLSGSYFQCALIGHTQSVRALAGHDNIVVSGSYDATVCVWDVVKGERKFRLTGHTQKVYSIVYDGISRCWSGSMDADVRCWDVHSGECLSVLQGHTSLVGLLQLSPEHIVSAAADSSLRVWDSQTNKMVHMLQAHSNAITCFQYDRFKAVSGSEGAIKLWDMATGRVVRDLVSRVANVWRLQINERWCVAALNRNERTEFVVMDFDVPPSFQTSVSSSANDIAGLAETGAANSATHSALPSMPPPPLHAPEQVHAQARLLGFPTMLGARGEGTLLNDREQEDESTDVDDDDDGGDGVGDGEGDGNRGEELNEETEAEADEHYDGYVDELNGADHRVRHQMQYNNDSDVSEALAARQSYFSLRSVAVLGNGVGAFGLPGNSRSNDRHGSSPSEEGSDEGAQRFAVI